MAGFSNLQGRDCHQQQIHCIMIPTTESVDYWRYHCSLICGLSVGRIVALVPLCLLSYTQCSTVNLSDSTRSTALSDGHLAFSAMIHTWRFLH
jgi:hypothetical protein